jgi:hypothetical protein
MKRKRKKLLVIIFFAGIALKANAQAAVTAPILESLMAVTHADQVIYYAQSIAQLVESAMTAYDQLQTSIRMEKRALENLKNIGDARSAGDLMTWYNRQLYLERAAEERFKNIGVSIGGKKYNMEEISEIPGALKTTYGDYWKNDFSEEQRKEMWLTLGLSPSNYMYIQAWEAREKDLIKKQMIKAQLQNEGNMTAAERNNELLRRLEEDKNKPEDEKMGEKQLLSMVFELLVDTNTVTRQKAYDDLEAEDRRIAAEQAAKAPANPPGLSEMWGHEFFGEAESE